MEFVFSNLNRYIDQSVFQSTFKLAIVISVYKKTQKASNITTDLSLFYQYLYGIGEIDVLTNISVDSEMDSVRSKAFYVREMEICY